MKKRLLLISPLGKKGLMGSDFYFRLPYLGLLKVAALTPPRCSATGGSSTTTGTTTKPTMWYTGPGSLPPHGSWKVTGGHESYSYPSIIKRIWGNGTRYNFFYPMNYGYRQSINMALRDDAIGGKWR